MRGRLLLPLLGALAACGPEADAPVTGAGAPPPLEAAVERLPAVVAGFTRGEATLHERERPGQGVVVEYAGPARAAVATVALYDYGEPVVGGSPTAPRVQAQFNQAIADVMALAGSRTSQRISEGERSELEVPGGEALSCARLDGTYGRQEVRTLVCLGVAAGRFLKVQVTSPARPVRPVDPIPFVVGIAQAARGV